LLGLNINILESLLLKTSKENLPKFFYTSIFQSESRVVKISSSKISHLYLVPSFHNPLGISMNNENRRKLIELSIRFGFIIIADDPYHVICLRKTSWTIA
jgi:DNA-binding transcriptional MocR family regulator